jgi:beta-glucosidase
MKYTLTLALWLAVSGLMAQPYKDPTLSTEKRVADLLHRMTLEEKVAQLRSTYSAGPKINTAFLNNPAKMDSLFGKGIGMINPDFDNKLEESINNRNAIQTYLKAKTRLGIPAIFLDEAHHGLLAYQSDVFPTSIALACSWDTTLIKQIYTYVAGQSRARGTSMVLAPVIDVCRDPRWGRTSETFGEDPYLNGMMGSAVIKGFQGSSDGSIGLNHVAATLKHFTSHGQSEGGLNQSPANYSVRTLREFHMEPFRLCIENTKPAGLMASYVDIDGIPSHANGWLLKDVLRKEWNYKGVVVSDWFGIDQLWNKHFVAADQSDAAHKAFDAGITVDLPFGVNYRHLVELVNQGKIKMSAIDSAVAYALRLKFKLGLFDEATPIDLSKAVAKINQPEGRALVLKSAEESMVLLKNANHILPIKAEQYKTIAVIGPAGATNYLGDYSGVPVHNVSILEALKKRGANVVYAKGCNITANGDTISLNNFQYIDKQIFSDNTKLIDEAVEVAKQADFVIIAIGENEQLVREAWGPSHWGDMDDLNLQSQQEDLVKAIKALGKPTIIYLAHGRPLAINWIKDNIDGIIDGWFTGEESGNAFANILFGDTNPSGKLTISMPRNVGQIPVYYNHKPSAQYFDYVTEKSTPLFPFGYGLSYTAFSYAKPRFSRLFISDGPPNPMVSMTIGKGSSITIEVDVTNTGNRAGDEIVQLYVHPKVASVTQPVKALKAFSRISLKAGETKTVTFQVTKDMLAYYTKAMKREAESGVYELMIGPNSNELQKINYTIQ